MYGETSSDIFVWNSSSYNNLSTLGAAVKTTF
jgi:hypothetical protein